MVTKKDSYSFLLFLPSFFLVAYFSYIWRDYQLDDALIYLRYIKNFQEGHGLVYNPGDKFNGLTSPLFTYTILAGSFLIKNLQILTVTISAIFLVAASFFAGKLFSKTKYGEAFTALMVVSFGYFYSTFGMETPLFLMLIALSLYLYKIQSDYFIISLALLIITRNEGVFLAAPMVIDYLIRYKKIPGLKITVIGLVIFLAPFIFNFFYYGDFLPATANAKIGQGKSGYWGKDWIFFDVKYLYSSVFSGKKYVAASLLTISIYGAFVVLKEKIAIISIAFIGLLLAFYGGLNIPNYHWYYAPFFFFGLIFSCYGLERIFSKLWKYDWPSDQTFLSLVLVVLVCFFYAQTTSMKGQGRHEDYASIGSWLKENTNINSSVAMVEIGTVGWYADRYIIDILGLTNKYNADYIADSDVVSWLSKYQPDYILRHEPRWVHEGATEYLEREGIYTSVSSFNFPGYVLLENSGKYTDAQISEIPSVIKKN